MTTGNLALIELIRAEIKERGPVSFAWFMQQALYHPEHGYYSSGRCAIGRRGDYFTNVSVGSVFGRLLAAQFAQIWEQLGNSDSRREQRIDPSPQRSGAARNFVVVEQGAHHAEFARDVLESARKDYPEFFAALSYRIIEPFSILQDRQSRALSEFDDKIEWRSSLDALEPFTGVHFSNELLDSMPVHLIVSQCGRGLPRHAVASDEGSAPTECAWLERFVRLSDDMFAFVDQPIADQTLRDHLEKLPARPAGYQTEVNVAVLDWVDTLSRKLERGYALAIDYGYPRGEFFAPHRSDGTLQIRAQHRLLRSPFDEIGHADITAHVEWTSIAERAESYGLEVAGFTDQHRFITGILSELGRGCAPEPPAGDWGQSPLPEIGTSPKTKRALQTLLHPEMLGRSFQVLALAKHVDRRTPLAGFKFAREPRAALCLSRSNV